MIGHINKHRILDNFTSHTKWRRNECLNMIASENVMSPLASRMLNSDMEGRYNEHVGPNCNYEGTKYSYEIEEICNELIRKHFITRFADVRPLSGSIANLIVYNALASPGDIMVSPSTKYGAHPSQSRHGTAGVRGLKNVDMAFDNINMNIDVEKTVDIIKKSDPKIVMFGASAFLFPHPIKEIKEQINNDITVMYNASHVFGLVYNKEFQQPFEEGADIITSCTNKTLQGPQGGVIVGNYKFDNSYWEKIQKSIFPGTLGNSRISRFHGLAITLLEMEQFGEVYADKVVRNAKALGRYMADMGFKVLCPHRGFTQSHQIIINVSEFGGGDIVAKAMAKCNIICNKLTLPTDEINRAKYFPSGIRLGVQELTRWGMKEQDMEKVAEFFKRIIIDKEPFEKVKNDVIETKKTFRKILFCFNPIKSIKELNEMLGNVQ